MTESEVIGYRAQALAKHRDFVRKVQEKISEGKRRTARRYEELNKNKILDLTFKPGDLVLVRDMESENSLSRKMYPRYKGPYAVIKQTKGGSCIIAELTGTVFHNKVAKFRLIPYLARRHIKLPKKIYKWIDMSENELMEMERLTEEELPELVLKEKGRDYIFEFNADPPKEIRLHQPVGSKTKRIDRLTEEGGMPSQNEEE
jgi:hypothetical protein